MTDYRVSGPQELPLGAPPPAITPPEGVIISRLEGDGWTRKYLYQSRRTLGGRNVENSVLISEIPPGSPKLGYRDLPLESAAPIVQNRVEQAPPVAPPAEASLGAVPNQGMPVPGITGSLRVPGRVVSSPFTGVANAEASLISRPKPQLSGAGPGAGVALVAPPAPPRSPRLAQAPAAPPASAAPTGPIQVTPGCPTPSAPMQLPDGKVIQLDDEVALSDLWQILPYMTKQCITQVEAQQPAPPPAQGLPGVIPTSPPGAGFPGFGPASGAFEQGGFVGGGVSNGTGIFGPVGPVTQTPLGPSQVGPVGPVGPTGPQGPPGAGAAIDFVTKTDGDFSAGPGSYIPIPGTQLSFTQGMAGNAIFVINACFGCAFSTNNALAISVDGTIYPLQSNLWHTFIAGVEGFLDGASAVWPMFLAEGTHTVQLMLQGIGAGASCSGAGLGQQATISANPNIPLSLAVVHQALGVTTPFAPVLVVDGVTKTDAPFAATGPLTPVPSTLLPFTVTTPGNVTVYLSAYFVATPFNSVPSLELGVILDGGTPLALASLAMVIGGGSDKLFSWFLTATVTFQGIAAGPHSVQMAYTCALAAPAFLVLQGSPSTPATVSAIHT